jgi:hypothetical protein
MRLAVLFIPVQGIGPGRPVLTTRSRILLFGCHVPATIPAAVVPFQDPDHTNVFVVSSRLP